MELYERIKEFPTTNSFQEIIRKLCNKSKHFNANKIEISKEVSSDVCGLAVCCASVCGGVDYYEYYIEVNDKKYNLENLMITAIIFKKVHRLRLKTLNIWLFICCSVFLFLGGSAVDNLYRDQAWYIDLKNKP